MIERSPNTAPVERLSKISFAHRPLSFDDDKAPLWRLDDETLARWLSMAGRRHDAKCWFRGDTRKEG